MSTGVFRTRYWPPPPAHARGLSTFTKPFLGATACLETDTALNLALAEKVSITSETDAALALTAVVQRPVGMCAETDSTFVHALAMGVNRSAETDSSLAESIALKFGISNETDTALKEAIALKFLPCTETDASRAEGLATPAGRSNETDTAFQLTTPGIGVGLSTETDTALALTRVICIGIPPNGPTILKNIFFNDLSNWTGSANVTLSLSNGRLRVTVNDNQPGYAYQQFNTPSTSLLHHIAFDLVTDGGVLGACVSGVNPGTSDYFNYTGLDTGSFTGAFSAIDSTYVSLTTLASSAGHWTEWDNVLLQGPGCVENDFAFALKAGLNVQISSETDTAFALNPNLTLGRSQETDSSLKLTAVWLAPAGLAAETDAALALGAVVKLPVGLCTGTNTARNLGIALSFVRSNETDTAFALVGSRVCVEFDTCFALVRALNVKAGNKVDVRLSWLAAVKPQVHIAPVEPDTGHLDDPTPPVHNESRFA